MNYYKHHLGDYASATAHLSWDEDCAYRRLLDAYYKREAPIPADLAQACRLARATTPAQRRAVETVLGEFFERGEDGWRNRRCDDELAAMTERAEKNRAVGKRGGRPRKTQSLSDSETETEPAENPNGFHAETQTVSKNNPSHKPLASKPKPEDGSSVGVPHTSGGETPPENPTLPPNGDGQGVTRTGALCRQMRALGIDAAPHLAAWQELLPAFSDEEILGAARVARERKPGERIHLNYLLPLLRDARIPRAGGASKNRTGDERAATIAELTGRNRNDREIAHERDVTGAAYGA